MTELMKKVRFEMFSENDCPAPARTDIWEESECQSPRPFINKIGEKEMYGMKQPTFSPYSPCTSDQDIVYECTNSSPYFPPPKNKLPDIGKGASLVSPSNDLDLSMLEVSHHMPRACPPACSKTDNPFALRQEITHQRDMPLMSIENSHVNKVLSIDNGFFIRRDNIQGIYNDRLSLMKKQLSDVRIEKENRVAVSKTKTIPDSMMQQQYNVPQEISTGQECCCHHCNGIVNNRIQPVKTNPTHTTELTRTGKPEMCPCLLNYHEKFNSHINTNSGYHMQHQEIAQTEKLNPSWNAVDKKAWMLETLDKNNQAPCQDVEKPIKEGKQEPTVSDLFHIIKLQNEQLQRLQDKVDMFMNMNGHQSKQQALPVQEHVEENIESSTDHKISIGVMTSFEVVHTSTVINKEVVKQVKTQNAQMQCNRSQLSVKEVIRKPIHENFLEGLFPVDNCKTTDSQRYLLDNLQQMENVGEEKTLNEMSLYNIQVDNATTPMISPDQTIYLDVRDYSESDSGSDCQSNVGWTYYNKVMTHVNGMLHDSDMPSSASALFRDNRQKCIQMQIDKTNISVTKRVKFGEDTLLAPQNSVTPQHCVQSPYSTDTSMKMNQLAAKYLQKTQTRMTAPAGSRALPTEMSLATCNYMEKHKILQGPQHQAAGLPTTDMPRFLDIYSLKQQPKLL